MKPRKVIFIFRIFNHTRQYDKYFSAGNGNVVNGMPLPDINYDVIKRELTPILNCRLIVKFQIQVFFGGIRIQSNKPKMAYSRDLPKMAVCHCQAWVQVQGLSQISKRPGPGACSYNCNVSTTTTHHHPWNFSEQNNIEISSCMNWLVIWDPSGGGRRS